VSQATGTLLNNRYRLEAEIGRGGVGVVYRAHDTVLDRDVAVKVLSAPDLTPESRSGLLREARSVAQLNHPNIVSVYDAGEAQAGPAEGAFPFVVMELVDGPSLHQSRPGRLEDTLTIARQVCAALEHAHAHGVVHRDLKPENVLLAPGGTAKLNDFGLARSMVSRVSREGTIAGTVFYLAPELALGKEFDGRADLYALGVMLYELVTGELPFVAEDPIAVLSQHLYAPVVPPRARNAAVPPVLDALITRLLSKDPRARPASAAEVRHTLAGADILDTEAMPLQELSVLERIERGRMVGRERELQEARARWARAVSGQGQTLLISGEPGIGKTRLVRSLATQVRVSRGRVLEGACYAEGGMPYGPFTQLLRAIPPEQVDESLGLPDSVLADLLSLSPFLRLSRPQRTQDPSPEDMQAERDRLFQELVLFFSALARQAPLMLVVEDIQWADSSTLSLLRQLARHLRHERLLLAVTYRDVEPHEAQLLHELLLQLQRERLATRLKLLRLDREQTRELLAVLFSEEITPEFLEGIYTETEGNPFFIEEVCKTLVESGRLYYADGRWHRPSMEELGVPQNVSVAIDSRVRVLPQAAQQVLRLAAILGRTFSLDILIAASELDEEGLLDGLDAALRAQLLEEVSEEGAAPGRRDEYRDSKSDSHPLPGKTLTFVHGLVASTLVESMTITQRRRLHQQAAAAIESVSPGQLEALAYHYDRAGNTAKATHYLLKAGDRARALYAFEEALRHYQRALVLLKEQGESKQAAETLMRLGLVYTAAFEPDKAREAYDEAFELWEPPRDARELSPRQAPVKVLRLAVHEPLTLDPARISDDVSEFVAAQLFEGLVRVDADHNVLPAAAARWKVADDGRRYTFRLREGLRWSDGSPLTAQDFEFAWRRNLRLDPPAQLAYLLHVVENARAFGQGHMDDPERLGVRALDDYTLEVRLDEPVAYLPQLLARPFAYPLPRHLATGPLDWADPERIVSNGAYRLAEWRRGEKLVLARNPHYHGRFPGNVERVECPVIRDFGPALDRYAADELDVVNMVNADPGAIARARAAYGRQLVFAPHSSTFYLGFSTDRPPFDDVRVRQAFARAVDREALVREASEGQYLPANGGFVPPGMPGHSARIGLAYDVEAARDLLAQAGYPGGRGFPEVSWLYSGGSAGEPVVPFMRGTWRQILGVELQAQSLEWGEFMERLEGDRPHLSLSGWSADLPDPDGFLRATYHSTEGLYAAACGWQNARYDALVEEAARVAQPARRMALYQEADGILVAEETVILPLCYALGRILIKPWVSMPRVPSALLNLKDVVLEREER
jgi:ABC-type oligopeptide transport system substrate-binding subunit/serine/threonine protein kinase